METTDDLRSKLKRIDRNNAELFGFHIRRIVHDDFKRDVKRIAVHERCIAIITQPNGDIMMHGSGLFNPHKDVWSIQKAAVCLRMLGILDKETIDKIDTIVKNDCKRMNIERIEQEALRVGYRLVKLPKSKKVPN